MRILFASLSLVLLLPLSASAQFVNPTGDTSPFIISVDPQYPVPFSQAILSVQSSSLDLANATLSVTVGGKSLYSGNAQPVRITLGGAGAPTRVNVTVTVNGTPYSQSVTIQPQDVALITEPVSSTPPLYPGKSLVPLDGDTRVVAIANLRTAGGTAIDPKRLSYAWTVDDTKIANSSGIGQSSILVASPLQYRTRTISVSVTSQDGSLVGGDSISLVPQAPTIRIYENNPLLGIRYDHALTGSYSVGTESTLYGAPFSFSLRGGAPFLQWYLNGAAAQTGSVITLRPTGSGQGRASLSLTGTTGNQIANAALSLSFGETAGSNFFGL